MIFFGTKGHKRNELEWVTKVYEYDFDIEYVKGAKNVVVDSLSKRLQTLSLTKV